MVNQQELWTGRGTKRPCFHWSLWSGSRARAPLCFCWSGSDCKMQPWKGWRTGVAIGDEGWEELLCQCYQRSWPCLPWPFVPSSQPSAGTKVAPRSVFTSILPCFCMRKRNALAASPPPALQKALWFFPCYCAAVKLCGDAALQISLLSPGLSPGICQDGSSSERRQRVRLGWITWHIDPHGGDRRMSAVRGLRQTFLFQQLPWNTQGSLRGFLSFLPPHLLLPFSSSRLLPSLSAKAIATDYPQGLWRIQGRTPKHMYLDNGGINRRHLRVEWFNTMAAVQYSSSLPYPFLI